MFKSNPSIVVVTRETRLAGLMKRWTTKAQAAFRLKQAHEHELERRRQVQEADTAVEKVTAEDLAEAEFTEYEEEDRIFRDNLERLKQELDLGVPVTFIDRSFLPNFDFRACLAVVIVGQDGLVANAAKYVGGLPILGVNPDPSRYDGVLLPFDVTQVRSAMQRVLRGKAKVREVTMAQATMNDGQTLLAFNDLFIGPSSHISARYTLTVGGQTEPQSSSGIIVSTGAGSTGWLSSVFNMAEGVSDWFGVEPPERLQLDWEDRELAWVVREPFRSKYSSAVLVMGLLEEGEELLIESLMPSRGVVFSDGVEADYLEFHSGAIVRITQADQHACLVARDSMS